MKTTISFFLAFVLLLAACKKHSEPAPTLNPNYFVFGYEGGFCLECNRLYLIRDDSVYFTMGFYLGDSTLFSTTAFGGNKYQLAKPLIDNFPPLFLNTPDSTYGFPPNPDQGYIVLATKINGVVRQWNINSDTTKLPVQIRPYIGLVLSTAASM